MFYCMWKSSLGRDNSEFKEVEKERLNFTSCISLPDKDSTLWLLFVRRGLLFIFKKQCQEMVTLTYHLVGPKLCGAQSSPAPSYLAQRKTHTPYHKPCQSIPLPPRGF